MGVTSTGAGPNVVPGLLRVLLSDLRRIYLDLCSLGSLQQQAAVMVEATALGERALGEHAESRGSQERRCSMSPYTRDKALGYDARCRDAYSDARAEGMAKLVEQAESEGLDGSFARDKARLLDGNSCRETRESVPIGCQAEAICSGRVHVDYWNAMDPDDKLAAKWEMPPTGSAPKLDALRLPCQFCGALHLPSGASKQKPPRKPGQDVWTPAFSKVETCCNHGMLACLPRWEVPLNDGSGARVVHDLWKSQDREGQLLRKYSRAINNAMAVSWLNVPSKKERPEPSQACEHPTLLVNGRLATLVGPLLPHTCEGVPEAGESVDDAGFAQLYVLGDANEEQVLNRRIGLGALSFSSAEANACPSAYRCLRRVAVTVMKSADTANMTAAARETEIADLGKLLAKLTAALRATNPWVRDFITASESLLAAEASGGEIKETVAVIDAHAAPAAAPARTYNAARATSEILMCMPDEVGERAWGRYTLKLRDPHASGDKSKLLVRGAAAAVCVCACVCARFVLLTSAIAWLW